MRQPPLHPPTERNRREQRGITFFLLCPSLNLRIGQAMSFTASEFSLAGPIPNGTCRRIVVQVRYLLILEIRINGIHIKVSPRNLQTTVLLHKIPRQSSHRCHREKLPLRRTALKHRNRCLNSLQHKNSNPPIRPLLLHRQLWDLTSREGILLTRMRRRMRRLRRPC